MVQSPLSSQNFVPVLLVVPQSIPMCHDTVFGMLQGVVHIQVTDQDQLYTN